MSKTVISVITPEARLSFPSLFKAKAFQDQEPKFSAVFLFPKKSPTVQKWWTDIQAQAKAISVEEFGKTPGKLHSPFKDGDADDCTYDGYAGHWYIQASSKEKYPPSVTKKLRDGTHVHLTEADLWAGCYVYASLSMFTFDAKVKKGVTFGLNAVLKSKEGEQFGFSANPVASFADMPATEDSVVAEDGDNPFE